MNVKLTLTLDPEVIRAAKDYALEKGVSLSSLVESHLKFITTKDPEKSDSSIVNKLRGSFDESQLGDFKEGLLSHRSKRHQ